jgi:hypothetical protein
MFISGGLTPVIKRRIPFVPVDGLDLRSIFFSIRMVEKDGREHIEGQPEYHTNMLTALKYLFRVKLRKQRYVGKVIKNVRISDSSKKRFG